ncbi:hypothetical protein [Acinetobacter sp. P1(2025)]|uniref:hypothetical protein n=1 Tax=Acinetobacter sp. P1(2025) TaxID=3446120 RepID=UPI003F53A25D
MKKEKVIYLSKVSIVFAVLSVVFAYCFTTAINVASPMIIEIQKSVVGAFLMAPISMFTLMLLVVLAKNIAVMLIKKPDNI